ncbi:CHAT domain-containing protein [Pseudanabaena sp. UWO310]|uniref:CHAT domain-containing protein n=1 Tax=Pseudanabaena sp. UWO310 TaxID=2480795 RepID=UPI001CC1F87F|nr:CHAT domain-containing protein [Pseudanabaena sp. UWO310]
MGLGTVYRFLGEYEKSIVYFQQSLALAKQNIDWSCEACSLQGLGVAYNYLGKHRKAIEYHQQSLAIAKQNKNRRLEAESLGNLGIAYDSLGEYQKAIEYHLQSLEIHRQIGDQVGQGPPLKNLGIIYFSLGQYQKAIEYYQQALAIYRQFGNHNYEGKAFSLLGSAFVQKKQPELAILFYKQSVNVYESIRKSNKKLSQEEQQSFTRTVDDTYRTLSDLLLKQGRVTEALQVLDLLKIQELEDYLKNVKGNNITEKGVELLAPEKAISDQLSSLSLDKIPELNQQLASKLQQLPKSEINKVPPYFQNIPQGAVLIYPFILEDRIELIIYSPNTLPINRTIPIKKEELQQLVTDFRRDLQGNGTENIKISSKKLYDLLIKPIETELQQSNATTILYAPDGVLRYIPLAALYDGKQYLIEKYRINNLIAYSLFNQNRKTQNNPSIFAGAYGNSNQRLVSGFSQLPATIPEVDSIQTTFANTTKITEKDFTAQASKDKAVGNSIVHLATHASFRSGSPLDSYVLFGDGSKATIFDISEWNLKDVNLFVLSACQTGLGTSANGAEILGFGYQVQRAGAKASIASLWEVSDGGTQLLMQAFYSQIKQGNISTSEALRQAQIAMINSDKKVEGSDRTGIKIVGTLPNNPDGKLSHPYYWSAFVLIGNGL